MLWVVCVCVLEGGLCLLSKFYLCYVVFGLVLVFYFLVFFSHATLQLTALLSGR